MRELLRAALIGCGGISERHARGFSIPGRCTVVAGADLSETNLHRTCDLIGIPGRYADHREMLRQEKPDIVAICTWPGSHAELTADCVAAGVKGILCEKPMAVSPQECDRMNETCRSAGVFLGVGHHYRFQPTIAAARDLLASDEMGNVLLMKSTSRDGLANNASHFIDVARFLLGDPQPEWAMGQVERLTDRHERAIPIEDCALGMIGFHGGVRLTIESDLSEDPSLLLIVSERGNIRIRSAQAERQDTKGCWIEIPSPHHLSQHGSFLDWMEGGALYPSHAGNGAWVMECIAALFESSRQRRRVQFPLSRREYPLFAMIGNGELRVETPGAYDIRDGGARWRAGQKNV